MEQREGEVWIEYVALHEVQRWPRNPKDHDLETLDKSYARFGFVRPLLRDETTGKLVAGHGRLEQLEARQDSGEEPPERIRVDDDGVWYVPVLRGVAFRDEHEAEAYLLADNRIGEGMWKDDLLGPILRKHFDTDDGLDGIGFDEDDEYVARLLAEVDEPTDANADPPAPPPTPEPRLPPVRSPRDAQWRVVHGDCLEVLDKLDENTIDSCVTDPPYGLEFMGRDWDSLSEGLPQQAQWEGRRGASGAGRSEERTHTPGGRSRVSYGGRRRPFRRCTTCNKREFSGSPCECDDPQWVLEYVEGPPSAAVLMQRWHERWARKVFRVLKPGGHVIAFGADRTIHRLMTALEDVGFELRHMGAWITAQVFPKSWNISKGIDVVLGAQREVVGEQPAPGSLMQAATGGGTGEYAWSGVVLGGPMTMQAAEWQGWGTALKTLEPYIMARKPLSESGIAQNVMRWRTGGLNIDGCRLPWDGPGDTYGIAGGTDRTPHPSLNLGGGSMSSGAANPSMRGRWPSSVIVSDIDVDGPVAGITVDGEGDAGSGVLGSASRFFRIPGGNGDEALLQLPPELLDAIAPTVLLVPKASTPEREMGLDGFEAGGVWNDGRETPADNPRLRGRTARRNVHVSVKPIALMRHLVRLVTPPGGTVLDPFTGSGSTGVAAVWEGFDFHGIEKADTDDEPYVRIARARVSYAMGHEAPPLRIRQQPDTEPDDADGTDAAGDGDRPEDAAACQ